MQVNNPQFDKGVAQNQTLSKHFPQSSPNIVASSLNFISNFNGLCTSESDDMNVELWKKEFKANESFETARGSSFYSNEIITLSNDAKKFDYFCEKKV